MATATEIATSALRRLNVVDALSSPSAAHVDSATAALTAMLASWEGQWLSGDVLPLDARFEQGIVALLAVRLAEDYGKTPGPVLLRDAKDGWAAIQGAFWAVPTQRFESGLIYSGQPTLIGVTSVPVAGDDWLASQAYTGRIVVRNVNNLYELVTEGTSAASGGPTGTGSSITDGTCVWCWRGVAA